MSRRIDIVLLFDVAFAPMAVTTAVSVCRNAVEPSRLRFTFMAIGLDASAKDRFAAPVKSLGANVVWRDLEPSDLPRELPDGRLSRVVYFKLVVTRYLATDTDRFIMLDCDTIVLDDIASLWSVDLGGQPLAAVRDLLWGDGTRPCSPALERRFGGTTQPFFNSGLLLVDRRSWDDACVLDRAVAIAQEEPAELHNLDQDLLNIIFAGRWRELPPRWNSNHLLHLARIPSLGHYGFEAEIEEAIRRPAMVHYISGLKPWAARSAASRREKAWFWSAYAATGLGEALKPARRSLPQRLRMAVYERIDEAFPLLHSLVEPQAARVGRARSSDIPYLLGCAAADPVGAICVLVLAMAKKVRHLVRKSSVSGMPSAR